MFNLNLDKIQNRRINNLKNYKHKLINNMRELNNMNKINNKNYKYN